MRILKIVNGNDKGGVFTCEKQFIEELRQRGAVVDVIILGEGNSADEYQKISSSSFKLPALEASYGGPIFSILSSILVTYRYGVKYSRVIENQISASTKYNAIIYRRPLFMHFAGQLAKRLKTKVLWHLPNVARTTFSKNYYNAFCKRYGIVQVANSFFTKSSLGRQCKYVVYPGFDNKRVEKSAPVFRDNLDLGSDTPVYGLAARMHEDKAQDLVVEAFVNSDVSRNGGHLLIAGEPLDSDFALKVQEKAGSLFNKQVHFLGNITSMPEFYSSVDVVINGRRNVEPFGITIAEAMGAGKPVIAYKLGGPSEMIVDGANGWLVDKATALSYQQAFNLSISKKNTWPEMGRIAKENSYKFTVEKNVDTLLEIINT
ncbi:glycosyltransferase family 4 protein [Pontibacter chitinilyticus]|uniref:glycosyltransferase family 4 protein n=1 Tax=Pontibacter chitinilyticus TaxID=2674989 RepID=UPI0032197686